MRDAERALLHALGMSSDDVGVAIEGYLLASRMVRPHRGEFEDGLDDMIQAQSEDREQDSPEIAIGLAAARMIDAERDVAAKGGPNITAVMLALAIERLLTIGPEGRHAARMASVGNRTPDGQPLKVEGVDVPEADFR